MSKETLSYGKNQYLTIWGITNNLFNYIRFTMYRELFIYIYNTYNILVHVVYIR